MVYATCRLCSSLHDDCIRQGKDSRNHPGLINTHLHSLCQGSNEVMDPLPRFFVCLSPQRPLLPLSSHTDHGLDNRQHLPPHLNLITPSTPQTTRQLLTQHRSERWRFHKWLLHLPLRAKQSHSAFSTCPSIFASRSTSKYLSARAISPAPSLSRIHHGLATTSRRSPSSPNRCKRACSQRAESSTGKLPKHSS